MEVDIYATEDCAHCRHLADLLEARLQGRAELHCHCHGAVEHREDVEVLGYRTSPVVVVDGKVVGAGHDAVHDLLAAGARFA